MKKILILLGISTLTLCGLTHAQSLGDIDVSFCNSDQTNQMDIITNSDQDTDICVLFKNNSSQDTTLTINFIDGMKNENIGKSCGIPEDPNTNFAKFIKDFDHDVFLQGNSEVEKHYTIHYPAGYEGISHGCISYEIKNEEEPSQGIRSIYRITHSIDIMVGGSQVKPKLVISDIYLSGHDKNQKIVVELANKGNIDQKITLTGTIKNRFGYEGNFETPGTTIPANSEITLISNEISIPNYKGFFIIKSNLTNDPIFDFDVTNSNLKNEYSSSGMTIIKNTVIQWNRLYFILIILIIALILVLIIKSSTNKKKQTTTIKKTTVKKTTTTAKETTANDNKPTAKKTTTAAKKK